MGYDVEDTIAAIASPPSGAARGIVRLSGPITQDCISTYWQGPTAFEPNSSSRCVLGNWQLPDQRQLPCHLYCWPNERSYTRQPSAEVHTLGCEPLLEMVLGQVFEAGARLAKPGEFTMRAFLAGRLDLPQAEAVLSVIEAEHPQQLTVSLAQLAGGLSTPLNQLRNDLLDLRADVEAGLDFVDEHIEFVSNAKVDEVLTRILKSLVTLQDQIDSRNQNLTVPVVSLRGRPNVGKSTLWNALAHDHSGSAIVSDVPGTTRDFLETTLHLDGSSCRLIDTAGVDTQLRSPIDQQSQQLSQCATDGADCVVLCLDGSRPLHAWEVDCLCEQEYDVIAVNKVDLDSTPFIDSFPEPFEITSISTGWRLWQKNRPTVELLAISALTQTGLSRIRMRLVQHLQELTMHQLRLCGSTATRCRSCIQRSVAALDRARRIAVTDLGQELLAAELREALDGLAEMVGEVYTNDLLDRVFRRFCIGK